MKGKKKEKHRVSTTLSFPDDDDTDVDNDNTAASQKRYVGGYGITVCIVRTEHSESHGVDHTS